MYELCIQEFSFAKFQMLNRIYTHVYHFYPPMQKGYSRIMCQKTPSTRGLFEIYEVKKPLGTSFAGFCVSNTSLVKRGFE